MKLYRKALQEALEEVESSVSKNFPIGSFVTINEPRDNKVHYITKFESTGNGGIVTLENECEYPHTLLNPIIVDISTLFELGRTGEFVDVTGKNLLISESTEIPGEPEREHKREIYYEDGFDFSDIRKNHVQYMW